MIHDAQNVQSNLFQAYDYDSGEKKRINYIIIKSTSPMYSICPIKISTAIF